MLIRRLTCLIRRRTDDLARAARAHGCVKDRPPALHTCCICNSRTRRLSYLIRRRTRRALGGSFHLNRNHLITFTMPYSQACRRFGKGCSRTWTPQRPPSRTSNPCRSTCLILRRAVYISGWPATKNVNRRFSNCSDMSIDGFLN